MISEFQELSAKISKLAELTNTLRRENAELRKYNSVLIRDNIDYNRRLGEAQARMQALLAQLPGPTDTQAPPDAPAAPTAQEGQAHDSN